MNTVIKSDPNVKGTGKGGFWQIVKNSNVKLNKGGEDYPLPMYEEKRTTHQCFCKKLHRLRVMSRKILGLGK